ncbi:peptidoglycan amidohydrolase family protein [Convivina praedatoris]|uniref:NlpC/P60 domain-containing protein n=1 Tax=Convivina praedatoris TaxID=2880963 RepID=A0ABM9D444_9LACO|nr:peptidoglycan amidohydrolase family protein [Convivina sp. LMG 32447]CAH1853361.1 hypothetical protein R077815_00811 [Convivina sp. LMG 32447]CAH1854730.1 hypothetical protein LMG032447_00925 [Convivina sp. LMG 32447]
MGYDVQKALNAAYSMLHGVTYSMDWDKRDGLTANGTTYFDCSGFVYWLLNQAGAIDDSYLKRSHFTGTLKQDLEAAGFVEVSGDQVQAGDIYIWGGNYGEQAGGACHTGMFVDGSNQISSCYYTLGSWNEAVVVLDHDYYWGLDGQPEYHFFHYVGGSNEPISIDRPVTETPTTSIDQFKAGGNEFVLGGQFTVTDAQRVNGIFQVRADELTAEPFDWTDNGIPAVLLQNVNGSQSDFKAGDVVRFKPTYNSGTIDDYDTQVNAVGIEYIKGYDIIWYDADKFWNHD